MPRDVYRAAASVLVLRRIHGRLQLLLLHKPRRKDAWQLPQGGVEQGENIAEAALRELKEEAGLTSVRLLGQSGKVYQYDFPPSFRRFRPDNVCGQRISYIFALAPDDANVIVDEKEIDGFTWVESSQVESYVRRQVYSSLILDLFAEATKHLERQE